MDFDAALSRGQQLLTAVILIGLLWVLVKAVFGADRRGPSQQFTTFLSVLIPVAGIGALILVPAGVLIFGQDILRELGFTD